MQKELLKVNDLKQYFPIKGGFLGRTVNHVKAVDGITFSIYEGETVSIVGESGCGKSTTGRSILRLDEPTDGEVEFDGENLLSFNKKQMRENRKRMQVIFQDPYASLNPRQTVRQILAEAMEIQSIVPKQEQDQKIIELMETVGLGKHQADRFPMNLVVDNDKESGLPVRFLSIQNVLFVMKLSPHWMYRFKHK